MAVFFREPTGDYGLRHGLSIEIPIPEGSEIVEFDADNNAELIDSLSGRHGFRWQDHSISGGQILRAGSPVTIRPPRTFAPRDFLSLFAAAELDAIEDSPHSIARASRRALYTTTTSVRLDSPELLQLLAGLQEIGLLTAARVARILSGRRPA